MLAAATQAHSPAIQPSGTEPGMPKPSKLMLTLSQSDIGLPEILLCEARFCEHKSVHSPPTTYKPRPALLLLSLPGDCTKFLRLPDAFPCLSTSVIACSQS